MAWRFHHALQSFPSFSQDWDRINQQRGDHILLDSRFIEPLLRHFGSKKVLLATTESTQDPALALIEPGRFGFWQTFQPGQSPLGAILLGSAYDHDPSELILSLMRELPGWALGFSVTQQDPDFTCFKDVNGSVAFETLKYIQTPRLRVNGAWEDFWKKRSKNLIHNLSRQRRRLKEQGSVLQLVRNENPREVAAAIQEYGLLESTGWKGDEGSAVAAHNLQGHFYRELMEDFCSRREGVIYRLLLNGKTVASDICLERNATLVILKTAYDESVQGLSPGLLLHEEIFRSVFTEHKIKIVEFYGRLREWHRKWTDDSRIMYHLNFYRYGGVRKARRIAKKFTSLLKTSISRPNKSILMSWDKDCDAASVTPSIQDDVRHS